jgi:hypothetical protein
MILSVHRKRDGSLANYSSDIGMTHPTSLGMRSGCMTQATTKNCDKSSYAKEAGASSKTRHDEPMIASTVLTDQACVGILSTTKRTLNQRGANIAPA